ncbi:MAG: hypothetical protein LBH48_06365 [Bifidobacteriaceae bacterium]|nr:hypothetical protein [Bifidobacteriaceae bacterium]
MRRPLAVSTMALILAGIGLPLALGVGLLARTGLRVTSCVDVPGLAGWLGTRFALVHADPNCAPGTMAPGAAPSQMLTVLACVALPVLLAHGIAALAALDLIHRSVASLRRVRAAIVHRWNRRLTPRPVPVARRQGPVRAPAVEVPPPLPVLAVAALRGPPAWAAA